MWALGARQLQVLRERGDTVAKKNKRKKNRMSELFGSNGMAAVMAGEIIGNALGQVLADALENYLAKGGGKKKLKKRLRRMGLMSPSNS